MTPLEEQLEKLARRWEKEADEGELLDEVAYALEGAADELRALLPLEVTDESPLRVTVDTADLIELLYGATTDSPANRKARTRLRAALTQKGEPRACTGCANGCAGCKGKGKPYGEELMRQLRQGQKGDNE